MIVLSDEFYREILTHPIPTDLEAAKVLSASPAALDLFMWLSLPLLHARGGERVPLFGQFELVSQLGSTEYAGPRKFREKLEGWLQLVRAMWPQCPASLDKDGTSLILDHATAMCHRVQAIPGQPGGREGDLRKHETARIRENSQRNSLARNAVTSRSAVAGRRHTRRSNHHCSTVAFRAQYPTLKLIYRFQQNLCYPIVELHASHPSASAPCTTTPDRYELDSLLRAVAIIPLG
jgi:hypothetical protein